MSDANLLVFGCAVSFIAAAGFYVYFRECFAGAERPSEPESQRSDAAQPKLRDVA